eukprot:CFRG5712T1
MVSRSPMAERTPLKGVVREEGSEAQKHGPVFRIKDVPFVLISVAVVCFSYMLVPILEIPMAVLLISFGIQWLMFLPAVAYQTEKFYDVTGSITYLACTLYTFTCGSHTLRSILATICVCIWCTRLGTFLFGRILKESKDSRFDNLKPYFFRFFNVWSIQGLWVFLTALPVYTLNSSFADKPLGIIDVFGFSIWVLGFTLEVVADKQKSQFRKNPANKNRFIQHGLWSWSRHPNYFGEIVLWIGLFIVSSSILVGWQWICIVSPVFVVFLLTKVSGVPLLEKSADERWSNDEEYQRYKRSTSVLVPMPPAQS